jgi:hypothetical protein
MKMLEKCHKEQIFILSGDFNIEQLAHSLSAYFGRLKDFSFLCSSDDEQISIRLYKKGHQLTPVFVGTAKKEDDRWTLKGRIKYHELEKLALLIIYIVQSIILGIQIYSSCINMKISWIYHLVVYASIVAIFHVSYAIFSKETREEIRIALEKYAASLSPLY